MAWACGLGDQVMGMAPDSQGVVYNVYNYFLCYLIPDMYCEINENYSYLSFPIKINFIFLTFIEVWTQWASCKVTLTSHRTHCSHTSMNVREMKFISNIYTLLLPRFLSLFVYFWCKSCKICDEYWYTDPFGFYVRQQSPWHDVNRWIK